MIVGVGIELVDSARFEAALERFGERLRRRLFTAAERGGAAGSALSLGARFAAKVAARRALARPGLPWRDVEILREASQPPGLRLRGQAEAAARALGVSAVHLTLTHDSAHCVGQVVLESTS